MNKSSIAITSAANRYRFECPYAVPVKTSDGRPLRPRFIPRLNKYGYPVISTRIRKLGIDMNMHVHRIVAYQKYGDLVLSDGVICRHRDNNKMNFSQENIVIGSTLDNFNDNPADLKIRLANAARQAGIARRVISIRDLISMKIDRANGMFFSKIAKKYGHKKNTCYYAITGRTYFTEGELGQP